MHYEIIGKGGPARIAILVPRIQKNEVIKHYMPVLSQMNEEVMICDLYLDRKKKKTSNSDIKEYLDDLLPNLANQGIEMLVVTQPDYFKVLTKQGKTDANIGDIFDSVAGFKATYCPNYTRIFYDPEKTKAKVDQSLRAVTHYFGGSHQKVGSGIIHGATYPSTLKDKLDWLDKLIKMDVDLTCDIEGFSLKHFDAGIGTITFCWDEHNGIAFEVDNTRTKKEDPVIRQALRRFFENFKRRMIYHNACYDVYVLIFQLFMDDILDQDGLLEGLKVMLKNWEDSQLITYLATNSCAGNELGLKAQAQEFAGNYAVEEINDITQIPLDDLLRYNLVDGLSTWYVFNKHYPTMVADQQMETYQHFKEWAVDIIQMQLTGLPVNMEKVKALDKLLNQESDHCVFKMNQTKIVQGFVYQLEEATGADTLEKLLQQNITEETKDFLNILLEYKASAIIISTFIPAFLKACPGPDGWHYLFGNFRLGGTLSGRLSSNNPNLQNIPSSAGGPLKSRLAKLIKECFEAPPGWLFVGLDFDSLEDRISALQTKDPEKLKVYTDGYDGHSLRAYGYFGDQMPDIDPTSVDSINSIAKR